MQDVGLTVAVLGFGELGAVLASRVAANEHVSVRVYCRPRPEPAAGTLAERVRAIGAAAHTDLAAAVGEAGIVISAVPASAAAGVAERCSRILRPGTLYADLTADDPGRKAAAADSIGRAGGLYADVAVLGTAVAAGHRVPMLASGPGAEGWAEACLRMGLVTDVLDGAAGRASTLKLLRSVYMKGRDALVAETMLAARRHGLEQELLPTISGPGEEVSFAALAERVLCSLALHAGRRAAELEGSERLLEAVGVEPLVTAAAAGRLRAIADMGLRERFSGQRPANMAAVLDAIDESSAARSDEAAPPCAPSIASS
jgi:3-hydroxyisobutyrate dehydrogenase-like beta-hydroxyacid dehydrogenase